MRIAYLDCLSGISGDMTLGALVDAGADLQAINAGVASLGLANCRLTAAEVKKKGFRALQITVEHEPEHAHRHLHHITDMIAGAKISPRAKDLAVRVFTKLAEAEAKVHGTTIAKVHFHEVGAVDSIADIVGSAIGWDLLAVDRIMASPVPTGTGFVEIAHGRCRIPAPATAELLRGVPLADSSIEAELTTPTGAAILAALADEFGPLPAMNIERIGYGAGQRDLEDQANLLRLLIGQSNDPAGANEQIWVVETNLDDASGELVGYCTARLAEVGALDVYTSAIQMKKNRPGVVLTVLCRGLDVEKMEQILFAETTTLGVRRWPASRHVLSRRAAQVETPWGPVEGKIAETPEGGASFAPEYESCAALARRRGVPLREVYQAAVRAFSADR